MTTIDGLLALLETDLRQRRQPSPITCRKADQLPEGIRNDLAPALSFLGFVNARYDDPGPPAAAGEPVAAVLPRSTRITVARLMLLRMAPETGNPQWTEQVLEDVFAIAADTPGGGLADLVDALLGLLDEPPLTGQLADFLVAVAGLWTAGYRVEHHRYDFALMESRLLRSGAPAVAWFAALTLPDELRQAHRDTILRTLPAGPYRDHADDLVR